MLNDNSVHAPPTTGNFAYNSFNLTSPFMPALGGTYVDPVFGETVRVSYRYDSQGTPPIANVADDIYAHHWGNANGTLYFDTMNGMRCYNPITGAVVYNNQPVGGLGGGFSRSNIMWHPTNPDKYLRYDTSTTIVERTLSTQSDVQVVSTTTLGIGSFVNPGGSHNWLDGSADIYLLPVTAGGRVWKRSTNTLYGGTVTQNYAPGGGWIGITADGNGIVTAPGPSAYPNREHLYYPIDHVNHTVGPAVNFWGLMSDHFGFSSTSDGHQYALMFDILSTGHLYRVDMTTSRGGLSEAAQLASAGVTLVMGNAGTTFDNTAEAHMTSSVIGANKDWIFVSAETPSDVFNGGVGGWKIWEQEILAVNMVTLEVRRLAHHRSRSTQANYAYGPKPSCSWDGSIVLWQSNMNTSSPTGAVYNFSVAFSGGGGADTTPPAAPTGLRVT